MNLKLYCAIAAVIASGAIGMMYITPSAEAASIRWTYLIYHDLLPMWMPHTHDGKGDYDKHQFPKYDYVRVYDDLPTSDDYTSYGTFDAYQACWDAYLTNGNGYRLSNINATQQALYNYCSSEALELRSKLRFHHDMSIIINELKNRITELETDTNEKNTRITGLESKISELVLIEKAHQELVEKFDQKNNTIQNQETTIADLQTAITDLRDKVDKKNNLIDNKNNRIDNLRDELKQSQNLADKRLDRIQNLKDKQDVTNTSIQDLIDMLQADPDKSTDDILDVLNKILQ